MKNALRYSNEIDWESNINCSFRTQRKLKFSKINSNKNNISFDFSGLLKSKKDNIKNNYKLKAKKTKNNFIIFNNKSLITIYYGILFTLIFGFLFFLTISITHASNVENKSFDESNIYNKETTTKLLENYLLFDNNKQKNNEIHNDSIIKKVSFSKYTVKQNDTFDKIAMKTGLTLDTLYLVNNISKKKVLKKGSVLLIPNQNGRLVTVNKNDSIFMLSNMYGIKWEKIADANNLQSSVITPGMKLFIPNSKMTKYEKNKFYNIDFIWPIKGKITSYFGSRIDPITGVYSFHTGIDIKKYPGAKIKSVKDGKVIFVGWQKIYGNFVMIKHNDGYISLYAHLNKFTVKLNQFVEQGEFIGILGSTGRTTGPHLHFEIRLHGKIVDPLKYLN